MAGSNAIVLANNAGAGTLGPFPIQVGGQYSFTGAATWGGGNIQLNMLDAQGNWIPVNAGKLSATGQALVWLPQGQVQLVITTSTAVDANLVTVPTMTTR